MTSDRIKEIQLTTAYPESLSVKQALLQVWNECEQERSYSEEEVLNLLWKLYTSPNYIVDFDTKVDLIEWFEQFKK